LAGTGESQPTVEKLCQRACPGTEVVERVEGR
jgi:hypothetical protein